MVNENEALITITTLPAIQENLRSLRERWEKKAQDAAALVCTEESVQSIKAMRSEMRKEFDEADKQRKDAKERYMSAWNEVEGTWKECVAEPFKRADEAYKAEISGFEEQLKAEAREKLQRYFDELCAAEHIDFLTLDKALYKAGVKIGLADAKAKTPRKLQDALAALTSQIALDMERIGRMEDATEIMVAYKITLDVGAAVDLVQQRKRAIEMEREAAERRKAAMEREAEAVKKVETFTTEPIAAPVVTEAPTRSVVVGNYPEKIGFKIYFRSPEEYSKVLPALKELKKILVQEGIRYE